MWDACFFKGFAPANEACALIKAFSAALGVQHDLLVASTGCGA
jgi:hypothetical protein